MSNKQVNALYKKVLLIKNKLVTKLSNSLNESVNTKNSIKNELNKISKLTTILDEENTYRLYATKYGFINEDDNSVDDNNSGGDFSEEDLANMFGTQDNVDANKPEEEGTEDKEPNEGVKYSNLRRLFEDDETE